MSEKKYTALMKEKYRKINLDLAIERAICFWRLELMALIIFSVAVGIIIGIIIGVM